MCLFIGLILPKNLWICAMMDSAYIRNRYYNNNTRKKNPSESFTDSKPNLNKMHIFGKTCFYVQNKTKLNPRYGKSTFVGCYKQSSAYLIYFPETTAFKRVRCVKFTDSYDHCSLSKPDENTEFMEYMITYDVQQKDNLNIEGRGK